MIIQTDSTVFNTNADCIVNTINCVSFMGKGLALEFALRYPKLEKIYKEQCLKKIIHTGEVYFYEIDGQKIVNFPTKFHFKYPSKIEWIEQGLISFISNYKKWDIKSVAFPILGANNGGLNPIEVEKLMIEYLSKIDIDVYICKSILVEGKEKEMIDAFLTTDIVELSKHIKLNQKQIENLKNNQKNIYKFSQISNVEGIGIVTYKSIYYYFYNEQQNKEKCVQLALEL